MSTNMEVLPIVPQRSIPHILRRQRARDLSTVQEFPPDFRHGGAQLDELYSNWGEWAERTCFVRAEFANDGSLIAASVASFDDWFLRVEHISGTTESVAAWIAQRTADSDIVIELALDDCTAGSDDDGWVVINCDRERLVSLEQEVTQVTRDAQPDSESWTQTAQTDLLSLVCLSARLCKV